MWSLAAEPSNHWYRNQTQWKPLDAKNQTVYPAGQGEGMEVTAMAQVQITQLSASCVQMVPRDCIWVRHHATCTPDAKNMRTIIEMAAKTRS